MKKKNTKKVYVILGIVAFCIYFLFTIVTSILNVVVYTPTSPMSWMLNLIKMFLANAYIIFYLIYQLVKKNKKADKILNIILLVVLLLLAISNVLSTISQLKFLIHYGGFVILQASYILRNGLGAIVLLLIAINVFGLILEKKKYPYKVFTILILVGLGVLLLLSGVSCVCSMAMNFNVRIILSGIFGFLETLMYLIYQTCYVLMIQENGKEI